jgi:transposase-like protein
LEETDKCEHGKLGLYLRQEGLYAKQLGDWRKQRQEGTLNALGQKRGPKPKRTNEHVMLEKLQREVSKLKEQLRQAELIIDVQKKVAVILNIEDEQVSNKDKK